MSNQLPPLLHQQTQLAARRIVGDPGLEVLPVPADQVQQQSGIAEVPLGAAAVEGFPILGQRFGRDWVEHQTLISHPGIEHHPAGLLQSYRHLALGETGL